MRAIIAPLLFTALMAAGCESGPGVSAVTIRLIDPAGENAASDIVEGFVQVAIRQGDSLFCEDGSCEATIERGTFDLQFQHRDLSFTEHTLIQAEISGGDAPLVGAVPMFSIYREGLETGELPLRLVMMTPGAPTCAPLTLSNIGASSPPRLLSRRDVGAVLRRNMVVLAGGVGERGDSERVDFFDGVVVEMRPPLDDAPGPIGSARGIALSEDASLVLGTRSNVLISRRRPPIPGPPVVTEPQLHDGAGVASASANLDRFTVIAGGTDSDGASWLDELGQVEAEATLVTPRTGAVAATGRGYVLVVGGGAPGAAPAEWLELGASTGTPVDGIPEGAGGFLVASPTRERFLWVDYSADGSTTLITGCPTACAATDGPAWPRPREGAAGVRTAAGVFWLVGGTETGTPSALTDRILWSGEVPEFQTGPDLTTARTGAAAVEHASGTITVFGGEGPEGLLGDVELCMPPQLDAL